MSSWLVKTNTKRTLPKQIPDIIAKTNSNEIKQIIEKDSDSDVLFNICNTLNNFEKYTKTIPKIAFTFWEGNQFSYLHYLTVKTLSHYNPDFKIFIYSTTNSTDINPEWNTHEHSNKITNNLYSISLLEELDNVYFIKINLDDYYLNIKNVSAVYKSDIIRILKLKEHGGIWFDFDILFYKKIPDYLLELNQNNIGIFKYHGVLPIGFILSHPNNVILDYLIHKIKNIINGMSTINDYQAFGVKIWNNLMNIPPINSNIIIFSNEVIYSYLYDNLNTLYHTTNDITTDKSIGIHWYNGAPISKHYINNIDFNNIDPNSSVMNKYVYKVLQDINESKE